jgi:hypothetical protein
VGIFLFSLGLYNNNNYLMYCLVLYCIGGARWPRGQCTRRTIVEAKKHWSVTGWVTKNVISRAPSCFGGHVKPLVPAVFAVVSTHQSALDPRSELYGLFSLWVIHKEGLCVSIGDIHRLLMMMYCTKNKTWIKNQNLHLCVKSM